MTWDSQVKCGHTPNAWFPGFSCVFDNCDGYLGDKTMKRTDVMEAPPEVKLNLGAGKTRTPGFLNVDAHHIEGYTDIVHNLEEFPWPFKNDSVDEIISFNLFEHLPNLIKTMEELHRILKPGGRLTIAVPYYKSKLAYTDPTHVRFFTENTMDYFTYLGHYSKYNYFSKARFQITMLIKNRAHAGFPRYHIKKYLRINCAPVWQLEWHMVKDRYIPNVYEDVPESAGSRYKIKSGT